MNLSFENKVALVTGAGMGMGLATVKAFAEAGATVVLAVWEGEAPESDDTIVPDATITTLHALLPVLDSRFPGWRSGREQ